MTLRLSFRKLDSPTSLSWGWPPLAGFVHLSIRNPKHIGICIRNQINGILLNCVQVGRIPQTPTIFGDRSPSVTWISTPLAFFVFVIAETLTSRDNTPLSHHVGVCMGSAASHAGMHFCIPTRRCRIVGPAYRCDISDRFFRIDFLEPIIHPLMINSAFVTQ